MYPAHILSNNFVAKLKYLVFIFKQLNVYSGYMSRIPNTVVRNDTYNHFAILIIDASMKELL